ncbi:MAG: VIT1/CCC1 transporter family protein [Victivallaceae bacterium]
MMDPQKPNSHFSRDTVKTHLEKVKQKLGVSVDESHDNNRPLLHIFIKETRDFCCLLFLLRTFLYFIYPSIKLTFAPLCLFSVSLIFIRASMITLNSWNHLQFAHNKINEERKEIEDNPEEEKEEIIAIYEAKGFQGKLLEEIADYLTSDSQLLLNSMIQEELKLDNETYLHPLKQGLRFVLITLPVLVILIPSILIPSYSISGCVVGLVFSLSAVIRAYYLGTNTVTSFVWNIGFFITVFESLRIFVNLLK